MVTTTYKVKYNTKFINKITRETVVGDIIGEESIDGKMFWIVKLPNRTLKLSKDAYSIQRGK